jgi:hypothetical protein
MTYSQKYAFLAALNLKTGIKDEDGYNNVEPLIVETSKPTPKLHIFTNETVDNKTFNADEFVKEWIEKMTNQAQHSISPHIYEKGIMPLREKYAKELQKISTDLMLQAKIDETEAHLKKTITNRKK